MRATRFAWLLALWLAGCVTAPVTGPLPVEYTENWALSGRLGIQTDTQSLSGQIDWQHGRASDVLVLATPLGQTVARIERQGDEVTLEVPNQPLRRAPDAETLTREALGYPLPIAGLGWWIQAQRDPARPADLVRDASGRVVQIRQDGWTIDFLQYADHRPRKLALVRDKLELRLVIDRWRAE